MNTPIIGEGTPPMPDRLDREYGGVHHRSGMAQGEIHDTEMAYADAILNAMIQRYSTRSFELTEFEKEAKDRIHDLGLAIEIYWKPNVVRGRTVEGSLCPVITFVGRVEKTPFDHDRQVHEVTRNVIGLKGVGEGVINTKGGTAL
ncbi:hypothetical protein ACFZAM_31545 [Streptomyces sp. NPDC008079]|uniref:hypothetical protein n=1 Tax=Streptomyces sp. NPDC008079 TaxID=3364806 RepID=UPI0036F0C2F8